MTIAYQLIDTKQVFTHDMSENTYNSIIKEFETIENYLKTMIHSNFIVIEQ